MLKRVHINGYKSLSAVELELGPLIVLFRTNASRTRNFLVLVQLPSKLGTSRTLRHASDPLYRGTPLQSFHTGPQGLHDLVEEEQLLFSIQADLRLSQSTLTTVNRHVRNMRGSSRRARSRDSDSQSDAVRSPNLRYRIAIDLLPTSPAQRVADEYLAPLTTRAELPRRKPSRRPVRAPSTAVRGHRESPDRSAPGPGGHHRTLSPGESAACRPQRGTAQRPLGPRDGPADRRGPRMHRERCARPSPPRAPGLHRATAARPARLSRPCLPPPHGRADVQTAPCRPQDSCRRREGADAFAKPTKRTTLLPPNRTARSARFSPNRPAAAGRSRLPTACRGAPALQPSLVVPADGHAARPRPSAPHRRCPGAPATEPTGSPCASRRRPKKASRAAIRDVSRLELARRAALRDCPGRPDVRQASRRPTDHRGQGWARTGAIELSENECAKASNLFQLHTFPQLHDDPCHD